jgi:hypothetical protein
MKTPQAVLIDQSNESLWEALVQNSAQGGDFLRSGILRELADNEVPKAEVLRVGVLSPEEDSLLAGWALLIRKRLGIRYNSNFPLFYSGPCFAAPLDTAADRKLHTRRLDILCALAQAVQQQIDICICETPPGFPDIRGGLHRGFDAKIATCHIWEAPEESAWTLLNRSKRNEANRIRRDQYIFDWMPLNETTIQTFSRLHDITLDKLSWKASAAWRDALAKHTLTAGNAGFCRLYATFAPDAPDEAAAVVSVLTNPARKTAYLWRMGSADDRAGLVPALYASASDAVWEEYGRDWIINFGGSPNRSLDRFKDYLGAEPVPHYQLEWQRPGYPWIVWNGSYALKCLFERTRYRLKNNRFSKPSR